MGWKDYFGFGGYGQRRKGLNRTKKEFNATATPAQKEKTYKGRMNIFGFLKDTKENEKSNEAIPISSMEDYSAAGNFGGLIDNYNSFVYAVETSKNDKLKIYREMSRYPEIAFAVNEFVSEAINMDSDGEFMKLFIKSDTIKDDSNLRKTIMAEWNIINNEIMVNRKRIHRDFRDFMIDGELAYEKVIDNNNPDMGIVGVKKLRTPKIHPIWDDLEDGNVSQYVYKTESELVAMPPDMVAYTNSGLFDFNAEEDDIIVLSFLENAKIAYRRVKQLEDALIIYRLVRAPERRIFNIDVSQLPKGRAEQYINELMTRYRQRKHWDSNTGQVSESLDVMAMTEDFWLPKFGDGRGHSVESLPGGENLGQIEDVIYFLKKLYRALGVPFSRFEGGDAGFKIGNTDDVSREEVRFFQLVSLFCERFVEVYKDILFTHLQLKGIVDQFGLSVNDFHIKMNENNMFRKRFEAQQLATKFENFANFTELIDTDKPLFSREWAVKEYLEVDDESWDRNLELLEKERLDREEDGDGEEDEDEGFSL